MNWITNLLDRTPAAAPQPVDPTAFVIDVRSPGEYASGFVEGAINLPLDRFVDGYAALLPDKDQCIVVYCLSGGRSSQAVAFLKQQGYTRVTNGGSAGAAAMTLGRSIRRS